MLAKQKPQIYYGIVLTSVFWTLRMCTPLRGYDVSLRRMSCVPSVSFPPFVALFVSRQERKQPPLCGGGEGLNDFPSPCLLLSSQIHVIVSFSCQFKIHHILLLCFPKCFPNKQGFLWTFGRIYYIVRTHYVEKYNFCL